MSDTEFTDQFYLKNTSQKCSATNPNSNSSQSNIHLFSNSTFSPISPPDSYDWRDNNGVTPVKNQGHCGSCWTFSTVGALEAHELIKYQTFTPLSEQQLVDCAGDYDNHGCEGGLPSHAFDQISGEPHGISTETAYPQKAKDEPCKVDPHTQELNVVGGAVLIPEGDEDALKDAVQSKGPVSVAFEVVDGFRDQVAGVQTSDSCKNGKMDVNHAVLAVGYGLEEGIPQWIVKNSWGGDWGDEGFFKIKRGENMCGIAVCNSQPKEVVKIDNNLDFVVENK